MRSLGRRHGTLAGQFLVLQLAVLALVLGAVALVTVQQSTQDFRAEEMSRAAGVAETLASTPIVRAQMIQGDPSYRALEAEIARATSLSGARSVVVVGADGAALATSEPGSRGSRPALGTTVQSGRSWSGDLDVGDREDVGAQAPVLDDRGRAVGAILVLQEYPSWWQRLADAAPDLLLFLGIATTLGVLATLALSRRIRRQTRGLEPTEIAGLADYQEALLTGIHEGVVGVGSDGRVTVLNTSARDLLGLHETSVGAPVAELAVPAGVRELLAAEGDGDSTLLVVGGRTLVLTRRQARDGDRRVGTVTTLVDQSDLMALQSRVAAQASITDTLRAQTHEFDNRLHTLSGLLQLREYDEAVAFIDELGRHRTEVTTAVTDRVSDPRVAALLVAKTTAAEEQGLRLLVDPSTRLPRLAPALCDDVLTVLGNLVDNALDATRTGPVEHGDTVVVRAGTSDGLVQLEVRDSGAGVPAHEVEHVFRRGWSTKAADATGRGLGLAVVQSICTRHGGSVAVRAGESGAIFSATLGADPRLQEQEQP